MKVVLRLSGRATSHLWAPVLVKLSTVAPGIADAAVQTDTGPLAVFPSSVLRAGSALFQLVDVKSEGGTFNAVSFLVVDPILLLELVWFAICRLLNRLGTFSVETRAVPSCLLDDGPLVWREDLVSPNVLDLRSCQSADVSEDLAANVNAYDTSPTLSLKVEWMF